MSNFWDLSTYKNTTEFTLAFAIYYPADPECNVFVDAALLWPIPAAGKVVFVFEE